MNTYWVLRDGSIECQVIAGELQNAGLHCGSSAPGAVPPANQPAPAGRHPSGSSRLTLTRRGRGVLIALALAVVWPIASAGAVAAADAPPDTSQLEYYSISAGESLWTIAERVKIPGTDTRVEVDRIKQLNHLTTSEIYAGQVILVDSAS